MDAYRRLRLLGFLALLSLSVCGYGAQSVFAQTQHSLTFTITPPLFQLSLQPGESWSSSVTAVNNNPYDLTLYAEPVLFESSEDGSKPVFLRTKAGEVETLPFQTLADWVVVSREGFHIPREQTVSIPFSIHVPADAQPGGHYAALLIGTRPPPGEGGESRVSVTSAIASLILLRVAGEVREEGKIWQFSTEKYLYETPEAQFTLKFKNRGNVHLQPQGDITIYNMFQKKRGMVPVNVESGYGNVLPDSERVFAFSWKSDTGRWDIGRYRAVATVGYGYEDKRFEHATTYFWVLPVFPLLQVLGGLLLAFSLFGWAVRRYVRSVLTVERARILSDEAPASGVQDAPEGDTVAHIPHTDTPETPSSPRTMRAESVDLRASVPLITNEKEVPVVAPQHIPSGAQAEYTKIGPVTFFVQYRYVFLAVIVCWGAGVLLYAYFSDVLTSERAFTITEQVNSAETP